jgi:hypothetical protein
VLATIAPAKPTDDEGCYAARLTTADRVAAIAAACASGGHRLSAAWACLRAASYYAMAVPRSRPYGASGFPTHWRSSPTMTRAR